MLEFSGFTLVEWWYKNMLQTYKAVACAALNSFSPKLINPILPKLSQNYLGNQNYQWGSFYTIQNKPASFNLDWTLAQKPRIHDGMLDLDFVFDLGPQ